jgi:pimeloyl-ACP methyl ester carboxylesterase
MRSLPRDGVALFYEEAVGEDPPVLLVHGIACDHTIFAPQFEHFARRDHRVVGVDLRGHGQSDKPHQGYTMQLLAGDLAWMCSQIGLEKPVVIGHSMGGVVALALLLRYPDLPSAIVMVDAPVVRPAESRAAMQRLLERLRGAGYREAMRGLVTDVLFISTDDQERKELIAHKMASAPQHVIVSAFEGMRDYDPHADPIPAADGTLEADGSFPLTAAAVGQRVLIARVGQENAPLLIYLGERGLVPGRLLTVEEVRTVDGVITVADENGATHSLGAPLAGALFVSSAPEVG